MGHVRLAHNYPNLDQYKGHGNKTKTSLVTLLGQQLKNQIWNAAFMSHVSYHTNECDALPSS
jgi:hypothetical protein